MWAKVICAAVVLYAGPETDHIPPLVHGTLIGEMIDAKGVEYFKVRYKDLRGRDRINYFAANTCKFKSIEEQ